MDKQEALGLLQVDVDRLREKPHGELTRWISSPSVLARLGASGVEYQVEIVALWDDPSKPGGNLRVIVSIDDGGLTSSFKPLTADFVKRPSDGFVGE